MAARSAATDASPPPADGARMPSGIPYIVGNEAAERFSFYGMRAILFVYLCELFARGGLGPEATNSAATNVTHLFMAGVYAFPMIGAILADRLWGKYPVIVWISLVYCAGHGMLALFGDELWGVYIGLILIAVGSGGIKSCVSANVGDQFGPHNAHLITRVYQIFYFTVNFGSFFATLSIPLFKKFYGPEVAFGVPGVLMALATLVFWMGRNRFTRVPPTPGGWLGALDVATSILFFIPFMVFAFWPHQPHAEPAAADGLPTWILQTAIALAALVIGGVLFAYRQRRAPDDGFLAMLWYAWRARRQRQPGQGFLDVVRPRFGDEAAEGPPAVLRIMLVFSMVSVFWALFDQHSSTWINQAERMNRTFSVVSQPWTWGRWVILPDKLELLPSQIPALNPLFVMLMIPALQAGVFGPLARRGIQVPPLAKMTAGMFSTAFSFVAVAVLERWMAAAAVHGHTVHVAWQLVPYMLLTAGEVLISVTGLEFAYTQAPRRMKSTIMGFWLLCITVGNLLVAYLSPLQERFSLEHFFWLFAGLMAVAAVVFSVLAYFYRGKTYLQADAGPAAG